MDVDAATDAATGGTTDAATSGTTDAATTDTATDAATDAATGGVTDAAKDAGVISAQESTIADGYTDGYAHGYISILNDEYYYATELNEECYERERWYGESFMVGYSTAGTDAKLTDVGSSSRPPCLFFRMLSNLPMLREAKLRLSDLRSRDYFGSWTVRLFLDIACLCWVLMDFAIELCTCILPRKPVESLDRVACHVLGSLLNHVLLLAMPAWKANLLVYKKLDVIVDYFLPDLSISTEENNAQRNVLETIEEQEEEQEEVASIQEEELQLEAEKQEENVEDHQKEDKEQQEEVKEQQREAKEQEMEAKEQQQEGKEQQMETEEHYHMAEEQPTPGQLFCVLKTEYRSPKKRPVTGKPFYVENEEDDVPPEDQDHVAQEQKPATEERFDEAEEQFYVAQEQPTGATEGWKKAKRQKEETEEMQGTGVMKKPDGNEQDEMEAKKKQDEEMEAKRRQDEEKHAVRRKAELYLKTRSVGQFFWVTIWRKMTDRSKMHLSAKFETLKKLVNFLYRVVMCLLVLLLLGPLACVPFTIFCLYGLLIIAHGAYQSLFRGKCCIFYGVHPIMSLERL